MKKNIFNFFMGLIALAFILYDATTSHFVLSVCVTACTLGSPSTSSGNCNERGGIRRGYWAKFTDIDWAAMLASAPSWDGATQTIKAFIMVGGAIFKKVDHDAKLGEAEAVYSKGDGFYKNTIKDTFMGQTAANRKIFLQAVSCCNLVYITVGNNCNIRIYGVDYDGTTLGKILTPLYIERHADLSGTLGGNSQARDEVDIVGESLVAPLFLDMLETAIPIV